MHAKRSCVVVAFVLVSLMLFGVAEVTANTPQTSDIVEDVHTDEQSTTWNAHVGVFHFDRFVVVGDLPQISLDESDESLMGDKERDCTEVDGRIVCTGKPVSHHIEPETLYTDDEDQYEMNEQGDYNQKQQDYQHIIGVVTVKEYGTVRLTADMVGVNECCAGCCLWDLDGDRIYGETGKQGNNGDEVGQSVVFETKLRQKQHSSLAVQPINIRMQHTTYDNNGEATTKTYMLGIQVTRRKHADDFLPLTTDSSTISMNQLTLSPPTIDN